MNTSEVPMTASAGPPSPRTTPTHGFSLLELLVVLALASVLAGIGALNHQAMQPGLRLKTAARQVVMELKVARMQAVARNVNHRVVFPSGGTSYQRQRKTGNVYIDDGMPVPLPP